VSNSAGVVASLYFVCMKNGTKTNPQIPPNGAANAPKVVARSLVLGPYHYDAILAGQFIIKGYPAAATIDPNKNITNPVELTNILIHIPMRFNTTPVHKLVTTPNLLII